MSNNPLLFNAAFNAAVGAGEAGRIINSANAADYDEVEAAALVFATALDNAIPTDASTSQADADLMLSCCLSVMFGRYSLATSNYASIVQGIKTLYLAVRANHVSTNPDASQATWFIDETNGNDNNSGATAQTALRSVGALNSRFKNLTFLQNTTVQAVGNLTAPFNLQNVGVVDGAALTIQGTLTQLGTATISLVTAIGPGTTFPWTLTTTGFDWTTIGIPVGRTISGPRITTNTGKVFWVVEIVDANNVVVGPGYTLTGLGTLSSPVAAETLTINTLSTVPASQFQWAGQTSDVNATFNFIIKDFAFTDGTSNLLTAGVGKMQVLGCDIQMPSVSSTIMDGLVGRTQWIANKWTFTSAVNQNFVSGSGNSFIIGPTVVAAANATLQYNNLRNLNNPFFQTVGIFIAGRSQVVGTMFFRNFTSGDVLSILAGSFLSTGGAVAGASNTGGVGINVNSSAAMNYQTKPTLTSSVNDTKIGGVATAYAAVPAVTAANGAALVLLAP